MNFVPSVSYLLCLNLSATFTQPGAYSLAEPSTRFVLSQEMSFMKLIQGSQINMNILVTLYGAERGGDADMCAQVDADRT